MVNQLKKWRAQLAYSQQELSIQAKVSPAMLVAVERYNYLPGPEVRTKVANALGISEATIWPGIESTEVNANGNS